MAELIGLVIIFIIYQISKANVNRRLNSYDMRNVSIGKMSMDSGKSKSEIRKNLVNGKYDKDDKWKI